MKKTMKNTMETLMVIVVSILTVLMFTSPSRSHEISLTGPPITAVEEMVNPISPSSFGRSKWHMYNDIYKGVGKTFYCGCNYTGKTLDVEPTCYTPVKPNNIRDTRTEAEHILPAAIAGKSFACWAEASKIKGVSGRKHCYKTDPIFKDMHDNLANLAPIGGGVNGYRGSLDYGPVKGIHYDFGACKLLISKGGPVSERRVEPPADIRGDVSRVYDYMRNTYNLKINPDTLKIMKIWKKEDPISPWERERKRRIEKIQGKMPNYLPEDKPIVNKRNKDSILRWLYELENNNNGYRKL